MGQIRVGTASWTDRTLIESGWYPPEANNAEKRLRYYARQFPLVEVDATYYALPAEHPVAAWGTFIPNGRVSRHRAGATATSRGEKLTCKQSYITAYIHQMMPPGRRKGSFTGRRGLGSCLVTFLTEFCPGSSPPRRRRDPGRDPTGGGGAMTDGDWAATRPEAV